MFDRVQARLYGLATPLLLAASEGAWQDRGGIAGAPKPTDGHTFGFDKVLHNVLGPLGSILMAIAPGALMISWTYACLLFIISRGQGGLVGKAKERMIRTIVVALVLSAYFLIKKLILGLVVT